MKKLTIHTAKEKVQINFKKGTVSIINKKEKKASGIPAVWKDVHDAMTNLNCNHHRLCTPEFMNYAQPVKKTKFDEPPSHEDLFPKASENFVNMLTGKNLADEELADRQEAEETIITPKEIDSEAKLIPVYKSTTDKILLIEKLFTAIKGNNLTVRSIARHLGFTNSFLYDARAGRKQISNEDFIKIEQLYAKLILKEIDLEQFKAKKRRETKEKTEGE